MNKYEIKDGYKNELAFIKYFIEAKCSDEMIGNFIKLQYGPPLCVSKEFIKWLKDWEDDPGFKNLAFLNFKEIVTVQDTVILADRHTNEKIECRLIINDKINQRGNLLILSTGFIFWGTEYTLPIYEDYSKIFYPFNSPLMYTPKGDVENFLENKNFKLDSIVTYETT